ncbi:Alpha-tocopherol transfer protein-like [Eumeta japonica]|uniref:Alpha-tocopherol transfer protein-like n=1 Tax=Eumeta variegata TaxID=151549 RepID=A0A4C1VR32_EUMVA|nr:Alpha-tocopherol transfer protein-like [Eumeta japonica]
MSLRPLSDALQHRAESELHEKPRRIASDLHALREWLKKQPHLQAVDPSDQWLIAFLRGCKFSLERSKEKLEMYYTLRTLIPEFFSERDPLSTKIQEILKLGVFLPLKGSSSGDAARVCVVRLGVFDPTRYHLCDIIKVAFMITEILMLEDDHFVVSGEDVIIDMKGMSLSVVGQWTPALARKAISCFQGALPVRQRGYHMLNTTTGFDASYAILRSFLSDKLKKRRMVQSFQIQVHNQNYDAMQKEIGKSVLPAEYGGEDGTLLALVDHWKAKVESYSDWFAREESQRSDEARRAGAPGAGAALFGVEGSFRKLEVD